MINKVTYKDEPHLFDDITEYSIDENMDHRRGSNFYRYDIVEFKEEDREYFTSLENFDQYIGTWQTNTVIYDTENGWDEQFSELTRVKKVEKTTYEWVNV